MPILLDKINLSPRSIVVLVLPLGLWAVLWLSIQPGSISDISNPGNFISWLHGLRAIFPYVAAWVAVLLMLAKLFRQQSRGFRFFGPLGLTAAYGFVGIVAAFRSPDGTVAFYWAAAYLSVPLVLWAIVWGGDPLRQIRRIIHLNWLIMILVVVALFAYALLNRDLGSKLLNPSLLLECQDRGLWIGDVLRSTGVGRYAAIAAIIALSMLWQPRWRFLWGSLLLGSLALLLTTGARGSFVGFAFAATAVILILSGRKAIIGGAIALVVLAPLFWITDAHGDFLSDCLLRGYSSAQSADLVLRAPVSSEDPSIPEGLWVHVPSQNEALPNTLEIPARVWVKEYPSEAPQQISIPTGFLTGTGRTKIWAAGWEFIERSPVLGYGFHADRLVLGAHIHNSFMHAMIQTGFVGTIPFITAILLAWLFLLKTLRNLNRLASAHRLLLVQTAGMLTFLSIRAIPESTGAFFGIDWLLLSPLLLYLHLINTADATIEGNS